MDDAPRLISYKTAAALMGCSVDHIVHLAKAAEYQKQQIHPVPKRLRPHLDAGFPVPKRFGERMVRIDFAEFKQWMNGR